PLLQGGLMLMRRFATGMFSIGVMVLGAGVVSGQNYPNKPIRIVSSGPGGSVDFMARQVAQGISANIGQPVIVENRTPNVGLPLVAQAQPDGYTLLAAGP